MTIRWHVPLSLSLFFTGSLSLSQTCHANGFPVVDVASIAQLVTEYNQMMTEYAQYLNQVTGLMDKFPNQDWSGLSSQSTAYYGSGSLSSVASTPVSGSGYQQNLEKALQGYGAYVPPSHQVNQSWQDVGMTLGNNHPLSVQNELNEQNASRQRDIYQQVSTNQEQSEKRRDIITKHQQMLKKLGSESDLATMQFMASQNQVIMDQLESLNSELNQMMLTQESSHAMQAEQSSHAIQQEISRLHEEISSTPKPMGRDNWGHL
ncbi:MAG: hypothetical protein IPP74_07740 [Alphaproteobacteria bacterium]|nr:hypothetical protein [Alphaproteobacteria bacterium]